MSAENLVKFFRKIDADNSGSITVEELNGLFAKFDKDGRCLAKYALRTFTKYINPYLTYFCKNVPCFTDIPFDSQ